MRGCFVRLLERFSVPFVERVVEDGFLLFMSDTPPIALDLLSVFEPMTDDFDAERTAEAAGYNQR